MRSYFFWVNSLKQGQDPLESIFPKVLYKLTTDETELKILQEALEQSKLLTELQQVRNQQKLRQGRRVSQAEADQRNIFEEAEEATLKNEAIEMDDATENKETKIEEAAEKEKQRPKQQLFLMRQKEENLKQKARALQ